MTETPYSMPEIYEIAFSFRDHSAAVDFLLDASAAAGLDDVASVVELGCGPGQYCREFSRRNIKATGLDNSPEMISYLEQLCQKDKLSCRAVVADFRDFKLPEKVDLAICMMATFHHLLSNRDTVNHLNAVADILTDNGLYIIEMEHPRDHLTADKSTQNKWTMERDGIKVSTHWGSSIRTDPLTEVDDLIVTYEIEKDGKIRIIETPCQTRSVSAGLIRALIDISGRFKISAMYGDLDINRPFDNDKKSWRMILVLRKHA